MKRNLFGFAIVAVLLATPFASTATTFFSDTFNNGSTLNSASPGTPTSTATYYEVISGKPWNPSPSIASGQLRFGITNTGAGTLEIQAQFPQVLMVAPGSDIQLIQLSVTFTDTQGLLTQNSFLGTGLYFSGGVAPIGGGLNGTASSAYSAVQTGGAQNWQGYLAIIGYTGQNSGFYDRQMQTTAGGNNNQDLVTTSSSSQSYQNPPATGIGTASTTPSVTLTAGQQYTEILTCALSTSGALVLTNQLYAGPDNTGMLLSTMTATNGTPLQPVMFDGLAFGVRSTGNLTNTLIDINSITVTGAGLPPPPPPPTVPVVVATNGSCAFSVSATGFGLTYQWHRNGTNLLDGGNISGATSDMLIISPAGPPDEFSGANGYYVTVTGPGPYSINSTTNSLTLCPAANLVWSGAGSDWDVATSPNWLNAVNNVVFNYGDSVTFDDTASAGNTTVNLSGSYLSASLMTVSNSVDYAFTGSGSIAGPGTLIYEGSGPLIIDCVNTYTGGTIISNSSAHLFLQNYNGLGTGPVTLAKAGGVMEVVPTGNATTGIHGDVIVADDFTIQFDGNGAFAGVFFGNLSGAAGKTLTLTPQFDGSTNRFRVYGNNTIYDANLVLNGTLTSQAIYAGTVLALYNSGGSQTYSGIISGKGGLAQRDNGITILNGQNTYSGGTTPTTGIIAFGGDTAGSVSSGPIGTGPLFLSPEVPNATGTGQVMAWGGARTIANPLEYPSATNNLTLIIGGTNALTFSGPVMLNGLDGTSAYTTRTFQVTNTALTTFLGVVGDGGNAFGLVKSGNSILALNNSETFTGPTTVSNGTLQVNGSLDASSIVTVCSNGNLAGTGTVNGVVTVQANGALAPGASAIGALTLQSSLTLAGNIKVRIDRSGFASDEAIVSGPINNTAAGFVIVTNTGAALQAGDAFTLFNKAVTGGDTLKVVGAGVGWKNQLAANGTIVVSSTNPPVIGAARSGAILTLSWPGYPGWLVQSNSVGLTSTNWFVVPNSGNVTTLDITIAVKTNVFYRLIQP